MLSDCLVSRFQKQKLMNLNYVIDAAVNIVKFMSKFTGKKTNLAYKYFSNNKHHI